MTIHIFGADGTKRVLSGAEAQQWREEHGPKLIKDDPEGLRRYYDKYIALPAYLKDFSKRMKKRGYIQPRTRATFGWRARERRASAFRFEALNPAVPSVDWDYAPVGEGTSFRLAPRTRVGHTEMILVWAEHVHSQARRRVLEDRKFYHACENGRCTRDSCALCSAIEQVSVGKNEKIVLERIPIKHLRVTDPGTSGVHESGNRPQGPPGPTDEEKAPYALTSTQREYKKGAKSEW